ncbi:M56 family metallopeptidase [Rhodococcus sp. IEGM 1330]|uniref:M56 family metallopeptidase n=1 Tax=Rhodococcus sp. IEGM 1330 TaxID=3082225 RepID=UPI00295561CC|nr:M56 family metallopeptidase [Rhodococcus sp. IEGM 1330]MDV8022733.1 M56 family metallopeptidase [Rhodococcus sp. IEGM 1330]
MIAALTLLVAAGIMAVAMPALLVSMTRRVSPTLALTAWIGSIVGVFFLVGSAVIVLLWPGHAPAEGLLELAIRCLGSLQHAAQPWIGDAVAVTSAVLAVSATARVMRSARRQLRTRSKVRDYHRDVIAVVARTDSGPEPIMWLDHPMPLAYSIDGRPGYVVATEGLLAHLGTDEQRAVLAHERAHLRGHHHRIVNICEILASALPFVPLFTAAPPAVRVLVEVAADRVAAAATSAETVRSALSTVSQANSARPLWALGLISESTTERLHHLDTGALISSKPGAGTYAAAAVLPLVVPAALAILILSAVSAAACAVLLT